MDARGRRRTRFGDDRPWDDVTASADGRWILATRCTRPRDGTAPQCESTLYTAVGVAAQTVRDLGAARAQFDRASPLVAFACNAPRTVRILKLTATPAGS